MKKLLVLPIILALMVGLTYFVNTKNEVAIDVKDGILYGSLLQPRENPTQSIVIISAGSGPTDRDGNSGYGSGKNNSLKALAYGLKDEGYATLRYDKRTSGKSKKAIEDKMMTYDDFVDDLVAWIGYIKENYDYEHVYLLGHSQGALTVTLASQQESVDKVICVAGTARPIDEILIEQIERQDSPSLNKIKEIVIALREGKKVDKISEEARALLDTDNQAFLMTWMAYNPYEEAKKLETPLYFIYGTTDTQVLPSELDAWQEAATEKNSSVIEDMNHVLKVAPSDIKENQKRYIDPSYELHPKLVDQIIEFLED